MKYAEVAVNSPVAQRGSFCYSIPSQLSIDIGQAVWVPFGSKTLQGIVVELSDHPSVDATKQIADLISPYPVLSPLQIELALWLSQHYFSSLFDAVVLMLPPGFGRQSNTFFENVSSETDLSKLTLEQGQISHYLRIKGKVNVKMLERKFGKRKTELVTQQLLRRQLIVKSQKLQEVRVKPRLVPYLKMTGDQAEAKVEAIRLNEAKSYRQASVLEFLSKHTEAIPLAELRKSIACPKSVIESLTRRGLVSVIEVEVRRDPLAHLNIATTVVPELIPSQQAALQVIRQGLLRRTEQKSPTVFLLHGVTGSGKTEIYLQALVEVLAQGQRGICLVPEISLTPQAVERFASRFPGRTAVVHSGLHLGEQFDEWRWIKEGNCDVVIGPRSALFAPQPDLGLIIIDEEHEWSYKQSDKSPRYHARAVAIKLAELSGAVVILGSATPDIETFFQAKQGKYHLVELKERVTPRGCSPLPEVEVVNLREELKSGNRGLFSRSLSRAVSETLANHEQVVLFLNRRGTSNFIQCRDCGFIPTCQYCSAALAYHSTIKGLVCHHCHRSLPLPQLCPQCHSPQLKFLGIGTQRVEEEARRLFPQARLLRWDRDVTSSWKMHAELLSRFRDHKADILIGTQMIAKGLDLPQVTLAGVISADTGLALPDFRAGERTFQLLCQVAGRAGRGLMAGRVIIQTYSPEHYALKAATRHDYLSFYTQEIGYRRQFGYPPFSRLARLTFSHVNDSVCQKEAERVSQLLVAEKNRRGISDLKLIGPTPSFIHRVRGRYQWQLVLCGDVPDVLLTDMALPRGWILDIDPLGMV